MRGKIRSVSGVEAIASIGLAGKDWYTDARLQIDEVCRLGGFGRADFTGVLAVTSPVVAVRRNIRITLAKMVHGVRLPGTMGRVMTAADAWLDSRVMSGPKVTAFYSALMGCDDDIVWDSHMIAAMGVSIFRFNPTTRRECDRVVMAVSRRLGLTPLQCQAVIWTGWRGIQGYKYAGYPVLEEYLSYVGVRELA